MMTRAALMAAVTAVAAQIAIPLPFSPVPFTLQVLAVILSGFLLGPRYGALHERHERRRPPAGAVDELALGMRRPRRDLRPRRHLACPGDEPAHRRGPGAGCCSLRALRPDKGGHRRARGRRRRSRHSRFADLIVEREAPRRLS